MAGLNKFQKELVVSKLNLWARWCPDAGVGYPRSAAGFSTFISGSRRDSAIELIDSEAQQVDRCVAALPDEEKTVIKIIYLGTPDATKEQLARKLNMSPSKFYRRRDSALTMIYAKMFPVVLEA